MWLCDGTAEDAMQKALAAIAVTGPPELDLRALDCGQLAAKTHRAYADAIVAWLRG